MDLDNVVYFDEQSRDVLEYLSSPDSAHYGEWSTDPMGLMYYWHRLGLGMVAAALLADLSMFLVSVARWVESVSLHVDDLAVSVYNAAEDTLL